MELSTLRLNPKADRRLKAGHLWIYSNEVDNKQTPLKDIESGQQVIVETAQGKALGIAMINPQNLICGRLVSRDVKYPLNKSLLVHRIKMALSLREQAFPDQCYRLIYGDSDLLPGLVVDRFHDNVVVQISTSGMEACKDAVVEALIQVLKPSNILLKNDGKMRKAEGLESYVEDAWGEMPELVPMTENGVKFLAPVRNGQKTGWFYDHRLNRARVQSFAKGKRVLDICSYIGGWGVQAAAAGAEEVVCVDTSASALELVKKNAELNDCGDIVHTVKGDAFEIMTKMAEEKQRFDMVILDPPAFIAKRKDMKMGLKAYERLNALGMRLLGRDGLLVSGSCSMHLETESLVEILRSQGRNLERHVQIIEEGSQGADHPVHPAIPETKYLKSILSRVVLA
jgi:23S rRNA (cytosine1962-C5)-methyltransferase